MATNITKQTDGSVRFDYTGVDAPYYFTNLDNVSINIDQVAQIGGIKLNQNILIISTLGSYNLPYASIGTINGVAKPATIQLTADLLVSSVFNSSGGGGAGTVTSVAGVAPDGSGNVPLTASNVGGTPIATFNAYKTSNDAAVAAATPLLQVETVNYLTRMSAAGDPIGQSTANVLDDFVAQGKNKGWYSKIVHFSPMLGTKLAGASVKFVVESGGATSLVLNGSFVEGDYQSKVGFSLATNTAKYIQTGVTPNSLGLAYNNIGYGFFNPSLVLETGTGLVLSDQGTASTNYRLYASGASALGILGLGSNTAIANSVGGFREQFITYNGTTLAAFENGMTQLNGTGVSFTPVTLDTEITLFGQTYNGSYKYITASISYFIVTQGLTYAEGFDLHNALKTLYTRLGRRDLTGGVSEFAINSISKGTGATLPSNRWTSRVAKGTGTKELNYGSPGSGFNAVIGNLVPFVTRHTECLNSGANNMFIMAPTNDITTDTNTTTGTAGTITAIQTNVSAVVNQHQLKGKRVIVVGFPYRASIATLKASNYNAAMAAAAATRGTIYVDILTGMNDNATPGTYISADAIHPNDSGHLFIAQKVLAAVQNKIYRDVTLDFPSIAGGAYAELTVTPMYGAVVNNVVDLGLPVTTADGILYSAKVTAADTVTVRATNFTLTAIDPASQVIRVQVTLTL